MGFQSDVQFLGQSRAVWQDRSLLDNKVLSGRNILWTDWGVASQKGSLSSEPEIPASSSSQTWTRALSRFLSFPCLPPIGDAPGLSKLSFRLYDKNTRPLLTPSQIPCHKLTHIIMPHSSTPLQFPDSVHPLKYPSLTLSASSPSGGGAFTAPHCAHI